jgi:hypothetical protein
MAWQQQPCRPFDSKSLTDGCDTRLLLQRPSSWHVVGTPAGQAESRHPSDGRSTPVAQTTRPGPVHTRRVVAGRRWRGGVDGGAGGLVAVPGVRARLCAVRRRVPVHLQSPLPRAQARAPWRAGGARVRRGALPVQEIFLPRDHRGMELPLPLQAQGARCWLLLLPSASALLLTAADDRGCMSHFGSTRTTAQPKPRTRAPSGAAAASASTRRSSATALTDGRRIGPCSSGSGFRRCTAAWCRRWVASGWAWECRPWTT